MTAQTDKTTCSMAQASGIPFQPTRGRWQWRALGLALGACGALLAAPRTGWIARKQMSYALPVVTPARMASLFRIPSSHLTGEAEARYRGDVGMAVANALRTDRALPVGPDRYGNNAAIEKAEHHQLDGELMALRDAMRRFPDSALPRAAFLRLAESGLVTLKGVPSPAAQEGLPPRQLPSDAAVNSPVILADFLQAAQEGARIEPDNAFFPTMAALVHLAQSDDLKYDKRHLTPDPRAVHAPYVDLDRAARLSNWNDHSAGMIQSLWRLDAETLGLHDSWSRWTTAYSIPDVNQTLKDIGAHIDTEALAQEQSRHWQVGIALRARLARIAALIRAHCPPALEMGMSESLFEAARTGELMPGRHLNLLTQNDNVEHLRANHFDAEADWIKRVDQPQPQPQDTSLDRLVETRIVWLESWGLLLQVVPFAVIGGFLAVRRYQRRFDQSPPRPLASDALWGSLLGFMTVFSVGIITLQMQSGDSMATISPLMALCLLGSVVGVQTILRRTWLLAQAYGLTLLCLLGLVLVMAWHLTGLFSYMQIQAVLQGAGVDLGTMPPGDVLRGVVGLAGFFLAVPACIAVALMIVSHLRHVPVAAGVARGFSALTLPCITLLLLTYVGFTFRLANIENRILHDVERAMQPNPPAPFPKDFGPKAEDGKGELWRAP